MPSETVKNVTIIRRKKTALDDAYTQKVNKTKSLFELAENTGGLESSGVKCQGQDSAKEKKRYMEARLLAEIAGSPEGVTLTEVAERIGVAQVVLGRVSRGLLKRSKIHKAGKFYFPATNE
jgi:hypothetical protein